MCIDHQESDFVPPEVKEKHDTFLKIFGGMDGGQISLADRESKDLEGSELTYGEIEFFHFLPLLKKAAKNRGGVFWDLGCGTGKPLIAAAASEAGFRRVCGVEILEGLAQAAKLATERYVAMHPKSAPEFLVLQQDMNEVDWADADVVYMSSVCFSEALLEKLKERGKRLRSGARIIALNDLGDGKTYRTICTADVRMTWGTVEAFVMERL